MLQVDNFQIEGHFPALGLRSQNPHNRRERLTGLLELSGMLHSTNGGLLGLVVRLLWLVNEVGSRAIRACSRTDFRDASRAVKASCGAIQTTTWVTYE